MMPIFRSTLARVAQQEDINFLLTNRIPRRLATRFIGWFSRIENPVVRDLSIATWRLFTDLDLSDARQARFRSLHDLFIRQLKDGARPADPDATILASPSDAILGAHGTVERGQVLQVKGFPYPLRDLLGDEAEAARYEGGSYVTLRLTSAMYHRFHAPHDLRVESVTYISGDTWNVNPIALKRIERLFCKNERAPIRARLAGTGHVITLVPVAAILVASIRLGFLGGELDLREAGPRRIPCDVPLRKGDEMGWFQHGSTIVLFAPPGFRLHEAVREGDTIRAGQALIRLPV
ncbi:archaetidylserine decarboxylase [Roseomonas indoligenes]|uniref:phosphatidylserine decarboxylase n=1 Tax=Roseomonas indoligenes TaxID=2820811 RepID=A0A940MVD8_9PROT|nr:archaetidylserine decarboxylase [Pararoseomonas indoligenes]MBP0494149.1 phosphatidylserine decarboxylase [Pararoseomonas indoligenes]